MEQGAIPASRAAAQGQLSCPVCEKLFPSKISRKRHAAYCRRKSKSESYSRKKSCINCTKAKIRCDSLFPTCSKCASKGIACSYNPNRLSSVILASPKGDIVDFQFSADQFLPNREPLSEGSTANFDFHSNFRTPSYYMDDACNPNYWNIDDVLNPIDVSLFSNTSAELDKSSAASSITQFSQSTAVETLNSSGPEGYIMTHPFPHDILPQFPHPSSSIRKDTVQPLPQYNHRQQILSPRNQPTFKPLKAFLPRLNPNPTSRLTRTLIINTLRSYLDMFLPGRNLPPFIHPHSYNMASDYFSNAQYRTSQSLPQPLAICASIVQMFKAKTKDNSDFIWSTVRMAQERLSEEASSFDDWNVVAALQAMTIYFILRISEGDTDYMSFDVPLVQTMMKLATKTYGFGLKYGPMMAGFLPVWREWALVESMGRTIKILVIIAQLFDIEAGMLYKSCENSWLLGMSLPCTKKLWEADSELEWSLEYANYLTTFGEQPSPIYDDFLNLEYGKGVLLNPQNDILEGWVKELDEFGIMTLTTTKYIFELNRSPSGFEI